MPDSVDETSYMFSAQVISLSFLAKGTIRKIQRGLHEEGSNDNFQLVQLSGGPVKSCFVIYRKKLEEVKYAKEEFVLGLFFINLMSNEKIDNLVGCVFHKNIYNITVKSKDNYSLCGDNSYFIKHTMVFNVITK